MRLIDADALAASLGITNMDCLKCGWYNGRGCKRGSDFVDACEAIEDAPTIEPDQRWIPCSERLPEALQEVIVTSTSGYVYTSRIVHGEFEYGGNVVAWMPLPEPYDPLADTVKKQKESIIDKYMRIAKGEIEGYDPSAPCPEPIDVDF